MGMHYPREILSSDYDNGTITGNRERLEETLIGRRIVTAAIGGAKIDRPEWDWLNDEVEGLILTLDNGYTVVLSDSHDCCAYTELEAFLVHPERVDHIITGVGTTDKYHTWHIYADLGDIMELKVGWSAGNPFYYGYGFDIHVLPVRH